MRLQADGLDADVRAAPAGPFPQLGIDVQECLVTLIAFVVPLQLLISVLGFLAWERTSSAGQGAGRRYTALTDRLSRDGRERLRRSPALTARPAPGSVRPEARIRDRVRPAGRSG
jgi:hypothetical protein